MLTGGPAVDIAGLEPMATFVNLPAVAVSSGSPRPR
jgi:hypothetical protein